MTTAESDIERTFIAKLAGLKCAYREDIRDRLALPATSPSIRTHASCPSISSPRRWSHLQASAKQPTIGKTVDGAIEVDLVDCMVALPGQLFYSTQIPVCLWFLAKTKPPTPNAASVIAANRPSSSTPANSAPPTA